VAQFDLISRHLPGRAGPETLITLDFKGFQRWCIVHRITGFLDVFHRPMFLGIQTRRFRN
jgi:hypothetical protein